MGLAEDYRRDGWVKVPGLIDSARVDALMAAYADDLLNSPAKFFRQNTNRYEPNRVDAHGHVINSFLDPHHYKRVPRVREGVLQILFDPALKAALAEATGHPGLDLMQSMLFDKNAATPPHQDWWYLDSVPNGQLAAAWIALEDIPAEAGRFYLMSGTHEIELHDDLRSLRHDRWLGLMKDYVDTHPHAVDAPAMRKGDVIIWNSRTIHGALATQDPTLSRKSLTAHYLPEGMAFGNLFVRKDWVAFTQDGPYRYFANQPEYSLGADIKARLKVAVYDSPALMRLARLTQRTLGRG
ncbi:phytanoyl-CoA dioxygenase family protein [Niveispirillum sp. KHB5.9]|uniref:phytanoyl-CoA dioxygenase family protein n=1 Tax=Niveispirillum sp. KHB5.9 TaxID=3400269 RepID=UPI003A8BD5D7